MEDEPKNNKQVNGTETETNVHLEITAVATSRNNTPTELISVDKARTSVNDAYESVQTNDDTKPNESEAPHEFKVDPIAILRFPDAEGDGQHNEYLCSVDGFDPQVTPGQTKRNSMYIMARERRHGNRRFNSADHSSRIEIVNGSKSEYICNQSGTWDCTKTEQGHKDLVSFLSSYFEYIKNNPSEDLDIPEIEDIHSLTPRQAILLANSIVVNLTRYDLSVVPNFEQTRQGITPRNPADEMSASQILESGLTSLIAGQEIQPLGICRNYAQAEYAVFMILKELQDPKTSKLNTTNCSIITDRRSRYGTQAPLKYSSNRDSGHQWCMYSSTDRNMNVSTVIIDPTFRDGFSVSRRYSQHDRFEPILQDYCKEIPGYDPISAEIKMTFYRNLINEYDDAVNETKKKYLSCKDPERKKELNALGKFFVSKRNFFILRALPIEKEYIMKNQPVRSDYNTAASIMTEVFKMAELIAKNKVCIIDEKSFFEINSMLIACGYVLSKLHKGPEKKKLKLLYKEKLNSYHETMSANQGEEIVKIAKNNERKNKLKMIFRRISDNVVGEISI